MKPYKKFSIVQRVKNVFHAGRGIFVFIKSTPNAWIHLGILAVVVVLGFWVRLSGNEWALIVFASGLVLTAEALNTAIEIDIDLTSPEYHPYARDTKDVAAGAVLISAITAAIIGLLVFVPHFI